MSYFESVEDPHPSTYVYTTEFVNTTLSPAVTNSCETIPIDSFEFDLGDNRVSSTEAYISGAMLALSAFIMSVVAVLYIHNAQCIAMRMRAAVTSIIYQKVVYHLYIILFI